MLETVKRAIVWAAKGVGVAAVIVLIFAPFTNDGIPLMMGSIFVGLACLFVISSLGDAGDWPNESEGNKGYWPRRPDR